MMISLGNMAHYDLAEAIRESFRKTGWTIQTLARRAKAPYASVHGLIRGTMDTRVGTTAKVLKALGLRIELRPARREKGKSKE